MGAESYESFSLQGLGHQFKPVFIKVVVTRAGAYESGHKDSFDCIL